MHPAPERPGGAGTAPVPSVVFGAPAFTGPPFPGVGSPKAGRAGMTRRVVVPTVRPSGGTAPHRAWLTVGSLAWGGELRDEDPRRRGSRSS